MTKPLKKSEVPQTGWFVSIATGPILVPPTVLTNVIVIFKSIYTQTNLNWGGDFAVILSFETPWTSQMSLAFCKHHHLKTGYFSCLSAPVDLHLNDFSRQKVLMRNFKFLLPSSLRFVSIRKISISKIYSPSHWNFSDDFLEGQKIRDLAIGSCTKYVARFWPCLTSPFPYIGVHNHKKS